MAALPAFLSICLASSNPRTHHRQRSDICNRYRRLVHVTPLAPIVGTPSLRLVLSCTVRQNTYQTKNAPVCKG